MPVRDNRALAKRLSEAVNKGNVEAIQALFPDESQQAVQQFGKMARTALPDLKLTIEDTITEKDKIVLRWSARATHKGDATYGRLGRVKGTGHPIDVTGITILQIADGKIVETWGETGELDALDQLKLLPKTQA